MTAAELSPNRIVRGAIFPEPVQILVVVPVGDSLKLIGKGLNTSRVYEPILNPQQIAALETSPESCEFDGDPQRFRLGIEALRLGLAFEYDPYFALSIARVDPLPHQLEAVYDYFLKLARIRFLSGGRPGSWQNDHGWAASERAEDPRTSEADAHRHSCEPFVSVAARIERQVPRKLRSRSRRRSQSELRIKSLAG